LDSDEPPISGELIVSYDGRPKPAMTIGRAEVARFMVEILDQPAFFGKAPVISEQLHAR
jgi:hypothetical protein